MLRKLACVDWIDEFADMSAVQILRRMTESRLLFRDLYSGVDGRMPSRRAAPRHGRDHCPYHHLPARDHRCPPAAQFTTVTISVTTFRRMRRTLGLHSAQRLGVKVSNFSPRASGMPLHR